MLALAVSGGAPLAPTTMPPSPLTPTPPGAAGRVRQVVVPALICFFVIVPPLRELAPGHPGDRVHARRLGGLRRPGGEGRHPARRRRDRAPQWPVSGSSWRSASRCSSWRRARRELGDDPRAVRRVCGRFTADGAARHRQAPSSRGDRPGRGGGASLRLRQHGLVLIVPPMAAFFAYTAGKRNEMVADAAPDAGRAGPGGRGRGAAADRP